MPDLSLKEKCETQIITQLNADSELSALLPKKQNDDSHPAHPYIAVSATVGKEISPEANIYEIAIAIEIFFDTKQSGQTGEALDNIAKLINGQLAVIQSAGDYGVIRDGEQAMQFVSDTIRKRIIACRLIAG